MRRGRGDPAKIELHAPAKLWRRRLKVVAPRRQPLRKVERRQGQCHVVRQTRLFLRRTLKPTLSPRRIKINLHGSKTIFW